MDALEEGTLVPERKVLDISGDGSNNDGGLVTDMRYEALKERIVINGLPIMNDRPNPFGFPNETDLDRYYLHCVTGGPRSFVEVARNFEDFPRAVRKKLLQEVADRGPHSDFDIGAVELKDGFDPSGLHRRSANTSSLDENAEVPVQAKSVPWPISGYGLEPGKETPLTSMPGACISYSRNTSGV